MGVELMDLGFWS